MRTSSSSTSMPETRRKPADTALSSSRSDTTQAALPKTPNGSSLLQSIQNWHLPRRGRTSGVKPDALELGG
ncbi:hypothetical protein AA310_03860 [Arthrobacter sp. YC-RL1]|nr:hypothetical protein AA310_03860 [Arthrobacter sp. YC-RL1]